MKKRLFWLFILFLLVALPLGSHLSESKKEVLVANGKQISVRVFNKQRYVSLYALCLSLGPCEATVDYDNEITLHIETEHLSATIQNGSQLVVANGRYLYSEKENLYRDKVFYVPLETAVKAVGGEITGHTNGHYYLQTNALGAIAAGDEYYDDDKLLWLSRIIHAESGNQPLAGKIAVGTVVMNRVAHPDYPNTIYGVIFDNQHGVQFTPTENGAIWCDPSEESVTAAKIVLEGYRTNEDILFFMNEAIAVSSWISDNCEYEFTIQDHSFWS